MNKSKFKTDHSIRMEQRDEALYKEFCELTADPEASVTKVTAYLKKKYGLSSDSSVWYIRRKMEGKLNRK